MRRIFRRRPHAQHYRRWRRFVWTLPSVGGPATELFELPHEFMGGFNVSHGGFQA